MAVQNVVPDGYRNRLTPCPRCGYDDSVLSVPAAHATARSTEAALRVVRDDEASFASRSAARARINAALPVVSAGELAMAPMNSAAGCGCLGLFFTLAMAGALVGYRAAHSSAVTNGSSSAGHGAQVLLAVAAVAGFLVVVSVLGMFRALSRQPTLRAGRPAAEAVWRRGWYCCRCAVVYFQAGEEPPGVVPGQPLTPTQFKQIVWDVGGYGWLTGPQRHR